MSDHLSSGGSAPFTALAESIGGVPVVTTYGEVDLSTVPRVEEACAEAVALGEDQPCLVLDLSAVMFMDSTGIGALVGQRSVLGPERLWLILGDGGAGRTIGLAGMDEAFRVSPDLETALSEARGEPGARGNERDPAES